MAAFNKEAEQTRSLLRQLGVRPQRLRGQNFLIDPAAIQRIAAVGFDWPGKDVVEIGPGLGALSRCLAEKAGRLTLIELESAFAAYLRQEFSASPQVQVVERDALQYDFTASPAEYVLFANVPYQITTPLLKKLFLSGGVWRSMVLLLQKEAAERICCERGRKNGPLSLLAAYCGICESCFDLLPASFYPSPAVTSTVIRIQRREAPPVDTDIAAILRLAEAAFAERRKLLCNSLAASSLPGDRNYWRAGLIACGLDAECRAESLSLAEFAALCAWQQKNMPPTEKSHCTAAE